MRPNLATAQAALVAKAQKLFNRTENRRRRFLPRVTSRVSAPVLDETEWSDIRRRQLFFVDKTAGLSELVDYAHAIFLARSHGMGKTKLCSQLYELFRQGPAAGDGLSSTRTWPERECYGN